MKAKRRAPRLASIIVPCWNQLAYTRQCVRSVLRCTSKPYELILVDNGSTDGTAAFLRALGRTTPAIRVVANPVNLGFGQAINQGMAQARGHYLVWLNNDAVVTPGWLDKLIDCAERFPNAAAVGPMVNDHTLAPKNSSVDPDKKAAALALSMAGRSLRVNLLLGFCLLLKRGAVEQIGGLDRRFKTAFFEDYDYCLRLGQAGYDLLIAQDAYVHHHWHGSLKNGRAKDKRIEANRELFVEKWCRFAVEWLTRLPTLQVLDTPIWTAGRAASPPQMLAFDK